MVAAVGEGMGETTRRDGGGGVCEAVSEPSRVVSRRAVKKREDPRLGASGGAEYTKHG